MSSLGGRVVRRARCVDYTARTSKQFVKSDEIKPATVRVATDRSLGRIEIGSQGLRVAASLLALDVHAPSEEAPASWRLRVRMWKSGLTRRK